MKNSVLVWSNKTKMTNYGDMKPIQVPTGEVDGDDEDAPFSGTMPSGIHHRGGAEIKVVELTCKNGLIASLLFLVVLLIGVIIGQDTLPRLPPPSPPRTPGVAPVQGPPGQAPVMTPNGLNDSPLKLTREQAKNMRAEATRFRKMLEDYYGPTVHMMTEGWAVDPSSPTKSEFKEGFQYMVDIFARSLLYEEEFRIGTIGSSVAAGHDNCAYDSYENQLMRIWSPVWAAGGKKFVHFNAGEGGGCGDSHHNQVFCVKQNIPPNVDIVHYSWTYFENRPRFGAEQHEQLIRWSLMMDKQPAVHLFNVGYERDKQCYPDENNRKIFSAYQKYGYNSFCLENALVKGGKYGGKVWGQIGDGLHNTTREGEHEPDKERKESLGVVWRNWHPGPLGFQLGADTYAYQYSRYLLAALDAIEAEWDLGKDPRSRWSRFPLPLLSKDLPAPVVCDPLYCVTDEPPACLNFEEPTYGVHYISVASTDDVLNPYRKEEEGGEGETSTSAKWTVWRDDAGSNNLIPRYERRKYFNSNIDCSHKDHCAGITTNDPAAGWLSFKLPKMEKGVIIVCGCCGKAIGKTMFLENEDLEFQFDGKTLDRSTFQIYPNEKCVRILSGFPSHVDDASGHLYLGVRVLKQTNVKISHIITV